MTIASDFRRRAFFEAKRYGGDAWVFIRELLQNSRDAGATRVDLTVERRDGLDRIVCRDDGCGMSFDHAREYLFTLYASSKVDQRNTAGRFGIGFWSVLRFEPDEVVVRSAPAGGSGWQLQLRGDLEKVDFSERSPGAGTEIELVRPARGADCEPAVWNAVRRDARHLRCRDRDDRILEVFVNSRLATAEIGLEPPSLVFAQRGLRGAVALTDRPRVDLLAHGLRVRTTATLDELLTGPDRRRQRRANHPDGLAPRLILDSRRLQVLMARGDARTDRELRRLVAVGRRGVRRLVRGQLDQEANLGWFGRTVMRLMELGSSRWVRWIGTGMAVLAFLAGGAWWLSGSRSGRDFGLGAAPGAIVAQGLNRPDSILRAEAAEQYRGPAVDPFETRPSRVSLQYRPPAVDPLLAVFRVTAMGDDGRVVAPAAKPELRPYLGAACGASCIEIELDLDGALGDVRLPVPTGHVLDPSSLQLDGGSATLWAAGDGGPLLVVEESLRGQVRYRTGAGVDRQPGVGGSWPNLPKAANDLVLRLRRLDTDEAASRARDWVSERVVYDNSAITVDRHRDATRDGLPFAERCLAVGGGDCDVQNTLLAAILSRAGISVRLAVGFVGAQGRALPGLHAWVEYRDVGEAWRAIDASRGGPSGPPSPRAGEASRAPEIGGSAAEIPTKARPAVPPRTLTGFPVGRAAAIALVFGLVVVGAVLIARHRFAVDQVRSSGTPNLVGLLRGALARPEAYREVPAIFSRRVVPLLAGALGAGAINLDRARALAHRGRLAVSVAASELARRVAATGLPVIDGGRPEGEAVAATLGAVDLDRWDAILTRGGGHPVTERLEQAAVMVGKPWRVVVSSDLGEDVVVLDGPLSGLGRRHKVIAVNDGGVIWRRVIELEAEHPSVALLLLADLVADRLRMPPATTRRLLAGLAAEAVIERGESRR